MKYTLVKPDGTLGHSRDFSAEPPTLAPNKGRWLPDNPPAFNSATHNRTRIEPVAIDAVEIPYAITPRDPAEVAAKQEAIAQAEITQALYETAKADTFIQSFINMTSAEVRTSIDSMTTGLPEPTRNLLRKMSTMLHFMARKEYK